jgi:hypothetical protein
MMVFLYLFIVYEHHPSASWGIRVDNNNDATDASTQISARALRSPYIDIVCHSTNSAIIAHHSLICIPHMFSLIDKNLYDSFVHFDNGVYV